MSHQHHFHPVPQLGSPVKQENPSSTYLKQVHQEGQIKQETNGQPTPLSYPPYHPQPSASLYNQPSYTGLGSTNTTNSNSGNITTINSNTNNNGNGTNTGSHMPPTSTNPLSSFAASTLSSGPYSINSHFMGLGHGPSTLNASSSSSSASGPGIVGGSASGTATPVLNGPSSPTLNGHNTYGYGNNGTGTNSTPNGSPYVSHQQAPYHSQYQQHMSFQHPNGSSSNLTSGYYSNTGINNSNGNTTGNTTGNGSHNNNNGSNSNGNGNSNNNNSNNINNNSSHSSSNSSNASPPYQQHSSQQHHVQFSAPGPARTQYSSLVPPLTDTQYAQYHQLLASPFSSTASTPYHSNHSTPYSSMPGSPTLEYQQLPGSTLAQKPKRRQVKNAC
ncbi:hypothetical protein BGZ94_000344, partial [Podila epigama]